MATIIFNSVADKAATLLNYSRTTTYDESNNDLVSSAHMSIAPSANTASFLTGLMPTPITRITIKKDDGDIIYDLNDVSGRITSVQESYSGGDSFDMYVNFSSVDDLDDDND